MDDNERMCRWLGVKATGKTCDCPHGPGIRGNWAPPCQCENVREIYPDLKTWEGFGLMVEGLAKKYPAIKWERCTTGEVYAYVFQPEGNVNHFQGRGENLPEALFDACLALAEREGQC